MTVGPPYWVEVLTKGGREIIWTTLPDKQVGYFCLPGLIPVGRYIPITPAIYFNSGLLDILEQSPQDISHRGFINNDWSLPPCTMYQEYANPFTVLIKPTF